MCVRIPKTNNLREMNYEYVCKFNVTVGIYN